jgi:hypothetical protein
MQLASADEHRKLGAQAWHDFIRNEPTGQFLGIQQSNQRLRGKPVSESRKNTPAYGLHTSLPLSKTIRQVFPLSNRQIDVKVPISFPEGSLTGPELRASLPESRTSTLTGSQENGARGDSKYFDHSPVIWGFPRSGVSSEKKMASRDMKLANLGWSRSAMVFAKARSIEAFGSARKSGP